MKGRLSVRSLAHVLTAGALALLLFAGLSLLFSHLDVWARSAPESTVANAVAAPSVLTPTSQTRSPEKGALITEKETLPIEGVAWLGNNRPPFPGDPTLLPIDNGGGDENYLVEWTEPVLGDYYVLYEADNPYFEDQESKYSGSETEKFIAGQPEGTYYYRVKSYNTDGASRWSNVESVTVGSAVKSMTSDPLELAAGEQITVWVRVDAGAWHMATLQEADWGGWEWSYDWDVPEDESYQKHVIHTRASAEGAFGPTDTITVTVNNGSYAVYLPLVQRRWPPVPRAPTLQNINNVDGDDSYTVNWSYGYAYPPVNTFVLQEATNPAFSGAVNLTTGAGQTSYNFTNKGSRTYYYRVKGRNAYGDGPWSAVKSVRSFSPDYYDDFSDPGSGWMTHEANCCLSGCDNGSLQQHPNYKYNLFYAGGRYHVKIPLDCRAAGEHGDTRHIYPVTFAPGVERPQSRTCMEVKGTFEEYQTYWSFWGLVFAASEDKSTVWSLEVNDLGDWAVVKRTGYDFPGPNAPWENENRSYEVDYLGGPRWPARAAFEPNTLRVEVDGNNVKLYVNGEKVHEFTELGIRSLRKVGIIGGDWEITPTQIGYSYFYVDQGCDDY